MYTPITLALVGLGICYYFESVANYSFYIVQYSTLLIFLLWQHHTLRSDIIACIRPSKWYCHCSLRVKNHQLQEAMAGGGTSGGTGENTKLPYGYGDPYKELWEVWDVANREACQALDGFCGCEFWLKETNQFWWEPKTDGNDTLFWFA